ncbi:hypothetical protein [Inquilinus sp. CA228]|uniref:hypothetical protein n=1 Tax=Inquilinus sp. CA228 TaxID=3455609 RepID=UPI003F8D7380
MMRVKVETIRQGQHPSELVVALTTADGHREELIVDQRSIKNDTLGVGYPIGKEKNRLLIELPRETLRGLWRVWVSSDTIVNQEAVA